MADNVKLNGFEIFDDFMPGGVPSDYKTDKNDHEDITESLTDEELEKIRENENQEGDDDTDDDNEEEKPLKKQKKSKKQIKEQEEEEEDENDGDNTSDDRGRRVRRTSRSSDADGNDTSDNSDLDDDLGDGDDKRAQVVGFFDALAEELGWEDIEDDEKPKTAEELIAYFKDIIAENSTPDYASEEVQQLDEYVRNGGDIRTYFQVSAEVNLDDLKIEDNELNQKYVIREFLREKGFNPKQIEKKIEKYEDAGLLEDEAEDALESLKELKEQLRKQLLEELKTYARQQLQLQRDFFNNVVEEIKGMDNIRGIKIPEKDKKTLLDYMFKADSDGKTKFNKDWSKSVKHLIESAYFTMKGDVLIKAALTEGSNKAINRFKASLNKTGISRLTKKLSNTSSESMWDSFVRQFRAE